MSRCTITLPSMTYAQKARDLLSKHKIEAPVMRMPEHLAEKGCAWGVTLDCRWAEEAARILNVSDLPYKKIWKDE